METKMQFDCTLGGKQELPEKINIIKFSAARLKEIELLKKSLKSSRNHQLAFQKLPKHMRRRVMSHNAKRLPRRLREIHLRQLIKAGMPQKKSSRKYRRRPKNLTIEFARRQNRKRWLETHLWHAKRFHMIEKWGYRLPDRPCDKSFRACYRATAKHCLVQDISYISCVQLTGDKTIIINSFKTITRINEGLSLGAKAFANGNREGALNLYDGNKAIGKILFNWHGSENILWVWIHAGYYKSVLELLNGFDENIKVTELKDELNRFRLTGPLSQSVLREALKPVELVNNSSDWLKIYLENDDQRQTFAEQIDVWEAIKGVESPSLLSPHVILSLIVTDPRYMFPMKRTKAIVDYVMSDADLIFPRGVNTGAIWDAKIRTEVKQKKMSNAVIADMRSKLLVPGTELEEPGQPVPIMLIQRPGKVQSGYCGGWDVIVPSGWAQSLWMCFIMWGARAGGLRETDSINFEMGKNTQFAPDTETGIKEEEENNQKCIEKYFRKPPNKRTNYNKFNIVSPFRFNWKILLENWSQRKMENFFVMRNLRILTDLQLALKNRKTFKSMSNLDDDCLISVRLIPEKGVFAKHAIICMPTIKDVRSKKSPVEPLSFDVNQVKRKELRTSHKELLTKLKRKRRIARKDGKKIPIDLEKLKSYQKAMRELWIAPTVADLRNSCSRQVMGFVSKGEFSFVIGNSCAVGYVAAGALKHFYSQPFGNKVLLRNTCSRQYRFASIEIIIE